MNESRRDTERGTGKHQATKPNLTVSDYLFEAVAGGVTAFVVGLFASQFFFWNLINSDSGEFELPAQAIFYLWSHVIVPIQSNAEQVDGLSLFGTNPFSLFVTFTFGFFVMLIGYATTRSLIRKYGHDRLERGGIAVLFAAAYAACAFFAANQYQIEETSSGYVFGIPQTVTMSVDPAIAAVAGFIVGGGYGFVGVSAAFQPTADQRKAFKGFGGLWVALVALLYFVS